MLQQSVSALRFLYRVTLGKDWIIPHIPGPKKPLTLPVILSLDEVSCFFDNISNLKHRTILMTAYAAGLRVSEVTSLRVGDIDSQRMLIRIEQGKGRKDRYVMLSQNLLDLLRVYWKVAHPADLLFPGRYPTHPITREAINQVCLKTTKAARLKKKVTVRALRHCFATHLLEAGANIRVIQTLLGNRHCPKCQSLTKAQWLEKHQAQLLPVPYFHLVFTLPDGIASLAWLNKKVIYNILFRAASETLRRIAADPKHLGAGIGFLAILHTWGQNLLFHPHLHCVVPGSGLSPDLQRWISSRKRFFLSVRVLSRLFRALFLHYLQKAFSAGKLQFYGSLQQLNDPKKFQLFLNPFRKPECVVYAKPPFGGPMQVLDYLGHYTHRVAISNHRLVSLTDNVAFRWRDYRDGNKHKTMTLDVCEFIRRFLMHVLPHGFVRIRHYGFLANPRRELNLSLCRQLLGVAEIPAAESLVEDWEQRCERLAGESIHLCPICRQGTMVVVEIIEAFCKNRRKPVRIDSS